MTVCKKILSLAVLSGLALTLFSCSKDSYNNSSSESIIPHFVKVLEEKTTTLSALPDSVGYPAMKYALPAVGKQYGITSSTTIHLVDFTYRTISAAGDSVSLSAHLCYPSVADSIKYVVLHSIYTFTDNDSAPSNFAPIGDCLVAKSSVVVTPDLQGMGVSTDLGRAYLQADITARQSIDCVVAAKQYLAKQKVAVRKNAPLYNVGYSQGGSSAMAVHKSIETKSYDSEKEYLKLSGTYCGSGLYDMEMSVKELIAGTGLTHPYIIPLIVMGSITSAEAAFSSYDRKYFFNEKFNTITLTKEGKTYNIWDAYDSRLFDADELAAAINKSCGDGSKTTLEQMLTSGFIKDGDLTTTDAGVALLKQVMKENRLDSGWKPSIRLKVFASTADDVVPVRNAYSAASNLNADAYIGNYGNHVTAAAVFYSILLSNTYEKLFGE